jgi:ABC-2 type transport system permease protein
MTLAKWMPFYYTTGAPTEILVGRISGADTLRVLEMQLFWIIVCYGAAKLLWAKGLRYYSGVGM